MENYITNLAKFNINKHLELPHHSVLTKSTKIPKLKQKYPEVIKTLAGLAKNRRAISHEVYINIIINTTDDAEEQYGLLLFFYKCCGIKAPSHHNYSKLSQNEMAKIREWYIAGKSIYSIAKALNRHVSTIYYALKRMGLK